MGKCVLAIDPGNVQSAFVVMGLDSYFPYRFGKVDNDELIRLIGQLVSEHGIEDVAIEMVASYGMAVGREVFDTCVWIGRFQQYAMSCGVSLVDKVYRMEEKVGICHDSKANDSNIRRALIDRFAKRDFKNGKGTKNSPDWFYGFSKDVWAAYAVGTVWIDKNVRQNA